MFRTPMFRVLQFSLILSLFPTYVSAEDALDVLSSDYPNPGYTMSDGDLSPTRSHRGQLRPVNYTVLSAGIDGRISRFTVRTGSTLKKGDVIARFYCEQEIAEHQIATARVSVADKNLEVNRKLEAYQNISELDLNMSEAELEIAKAEARRTRSVVDQCEIRAPFNATVTDKQAQAYEYVSKGDPLLEIVDTETLEIEMVLPSLEVLQYKKGLPFEVTIDETGMVVQAKIDRVVNVVDPVSQTIRVIGTIADSSAGLMPGMSGVVRFSRN